MAPDPAELMWPAVDLQQAAGLLRDGRATARDVVDAHLARLAAVEPTLRACLTVLGTQARARAAWADLRRNGEAAAQDLPLLGLPIAIKDNFETAGTATTAGSASLAGYLPRRDAAVVDRLSRAGAVFVAKVNLDEFAYGGESANPLATTLNPWDAASVPGGSSGGSGAAVAAGACMAATGSDTGGSIRNPSAWCGVTGFKPTFGAVDPAGVVPLAWSLDTVGFLARTVGDCAVLFSETADALVSASPAHRHRFRTLAQSPPPRRPRLAVAANLFALCEPPIRDPLRQAVATLAEHCDVEEADLPRPDDAILATMTILTAEGAAAWESGLRTAWDRYGPPVRAALDLGRLLRATEYIHAQRVREGLRREVAELYAPFDAVLMPAMGIDPRPGVFETAAVGPQSPMWELEAKFTCMWNLTGSPVVSVPCAFSPSGRPLAMQVVAQPGRDDLALRIAGFTQECWSIPRARLVPDWVRSRT